MGSDEVWRARIDAPHPKSYLAFIKHVHEEVERVDGPQPCVWAGPVALESVPASRQAYWRHWNPVLETFEREIRRSVAERLDAIRRPELTADDPAMQAVTELLFQGHRAVLMAEDAEASARSGVVEAEFPIKPIWALTYFVKSGLRTADPSKSENALNAATAQYLSQGIPAGYARRYAISRNHVDRACKRFISSLLGRVNSTGAKEGQDHIIRATFLLWEARLRTIEAMAAEAVAQTGMRGKTGVELAAAIDRQHGIHRTFYRLLEQQDLKWSA